jgi:hypothetical protein
VADQVTESLQCNVDSIIPARYGGRPDFRAFRLGGGHARLPDPDDVRNQKKKVEKKESEGTTRRGKRKKKGGRTRGKREMTRDINASSFWPRKGHVS